MKVGKEKALQCLLIVFIIPCVIECNKPVSIGLDGQKLGNGSYINMGSYSTDGTFVPFDSIKYRYENLMLVRDDSVLISIHPFGPTCETFQQNGRYTITEDSLCFIEMQERQRERNSCSGDWSPWIKLTPPCFQCRKVSKSGFEFESVSPINFEKVWVAFNKLGD